MGSYEALVARGIDFHKFVKEDDEGGGTAGGGGDTAAGKAAGEVGGWLRGVGARGCVRAPWRVDVPCRRSCLPACLPG